MAAGIAMGAPTVGLPQGGRAIFRQPGIFDRFTRRTRAPHASLPHPVWERPPRMLYSP